MKLDPTKLYEQFEGYVTEEEIRKYMEDEGVRIPKAPDGETWPKIEGLEDLTGSALVEYLNILTMWHDTRLYEFKVAELLVDDIEDIYQDVYDQVYVTKTGTPADRARFTNLNPNVRRFKQLRRRAIRKKKAMDCELRALKRRLQTVSRAVAVLESETRIDGRNMNVGQRTRERIMGQRED